MIFKPTQLAGAFIIEPERSGDERGFFARTYCRQEFLDHGLNPDLAQCGISFNAAEGTLRGLHYQAEPHAEDKLIRCTQGEIFDVLVDLRPDSTTFREWVGTLLSAENRRMFYAPVGLAHGFLTLKPDTEIFYQISESYHPEVARGVRWNDEAFGIEWPGEPKVISERDRTYPDFLQSS